MNDEAKVAVITGASRGIGRAAALRLARHGVRLILAARTLDTGESVWPGSLEETAAQARALGAEVSTVKCDVSVRAEVEDLYNFTLDKYCRADILINNAAYSDSTREGNEGFEPFLEQSIGSWENYLAGNVLANIIACKICLPSMIEKRRGIILCLTSRAATLNTGLPGEGGTNAAYPTTKAALNRFVNFVAEEIREYGIPIIAFCPGPTMVERMQQTASRFGIPTDRPISGLSFHSVDVPAAAIEYLCCVCPDPMRYTGQFVLATDLVKEFGLL
jgi:NAD(P)-dependent dehydrogenase (short-subunit alcohol dehydrogenase family)